MITHGFTACDEYYTENIRAEAFTPYNDLPLLGFFGTESTDATYVVQARRFYAAVRRAFD